MSDFDQIRARFHSATTPAARHEAVLAYRQAVERKGLLKAIEFFESQEIDSEGVNSFLNDLLT